jgi:long-chain fatty acid transport protein
MFFAKWSLGVIGCCLILAPSLGMAQGIIFPWSGPVSRSMGGATTATAIDPVSTTYWNPAAMADFQGNALGFGVDVLFPQIRTSSSAFGLSDTTDGESGAIPLPYVGWIQETANADIKFGLSVAAVGGAKANYPASASNPIFFPQSNSIFLPGGLGRVSTAAQFMQIMPSLSFTLTDRWAIAVAPTVTLGQLEVEPFLLAGPDDADGSGMPRYSSGAGSRMQWGGGFQISSYFKANADLSFGATYRSRQWMETFQLFGTDELGFPRALTADFDLPEMLSVGMAYQGFQRTVFAVDARYVGNSGTAGWGGSGFNPDGSLVGLGYGDQYMVGVGVRRRMSERFSMSGGYTFTSSPLSSSEATIGVMAPLHYQHVYGLGGTLHLSANTDFNVAYTYSPTSELSGPILTPMGALPGSNVTTELSVHAASFGVSVRY